jgi:hypothetical protein
MLPTRASRPRGHLTRDGSAMMAMPGSILTREPARSTPMRCSLARLAVPLRQQPVPPPPVMTVGLQNRRN